MENKFFTGKELDKVDIKALKQADSICFRYDKNCSQIECVKEIKNDPWQKEARHNIAAGHRQTIHRIDYNQEERREMISCFHLIFSAQYNEAWQTAISFIKAGDHLNLHWMADNNSEILNKNNLHHDELMLEIKRGDKKFVFNIESEVCLDNSARMIQVKAPLYSVAI